jgi:dTDP-D-glucose 4,6-dehydratase
MFGVFVLWKPPDIWHDRFVQISTDEVYGSIAEGSFTEEYRLNREILTRQ